MGARFRALPPASPPVGGGGRQLRTVLVVTLQAAIRYLGLVLQLAGFATIIWNLIDLRRRFSDQPSLLTVVRQRLSRTASTMERHVRRLLRRPAPHVHLTAIAADGLGLTDEATAAVRYGRLDGRLPVADLLALLDARSREMQERIVRLERGELAEKESRERADAEERAARMAADEGLEKRIPTSRLGGFGSSGSA